MQSLHEDYALFRELGKGSGAALARIHELYSSLLIAYSLEMVMDKGLAEEIVMDTLQTLWENRKAVAEMKKPVGWLVKCVYHKSLNEMESRKRRHIVPITDKLDLPAPGSVQNNLEAKELFRLAEQGMEKLPPGQKNILQLRNQAGLSRKEIARLYKISESTVKNQINNAYKNLRKIIKKLSG